MRNTRTIILTLSFAWASVSTAIAGFKLQAPAGTFAPSAEITLARHDVDQRSTVRVSANQSNSDGSLELELGQEPGIYVLKGSDAAEITLAVAEAETIKLNLREGKLVAHGSPGTQILENYESFRKESLARLVYPTRRNIKQAKSRGASDDEIVRLTQAEVDAYQEHLQELNDFVIERAKDTMALYGASLRLSGDYRLQELSQLVEAFAERHGPIQATQSLRKRIDTARTVAIGGVAPELKGKTLEGDEVSLSQYRGRYVLVDFWASWCPPCRLENKHYSELVKKVADRRFEIFAVNLDTTEKAWSRAVERDQATWVHVSDLQGWNSPLAAGYGVTALPASFLLDPDGRIIAKNLRGEALDNELRDLGLL
ncbi:TlpA family protein disulfide reductase [Pelagicoccus sp. NFK12]|uniref:TlpA family protein disulfide reductase n=1 Tax=Pelagicoccus enzymogenes TaxID=2773457 RepID=A0A927FAY4_9BACT|nr:TlpA disulfide reductase family protein [Pelagicoccus enzymogenes]MBD5780456.1 TlpA family protein disulfide reductase [Pelagicoccus enzymogenes]